MNWDSEVESPATIAIIGAGHVGIEAAIYARFLGYDIMLFDTGRPARTAKRWHKRSLNRTVNELTTPLGWAALLAQDETLKKTDANVMWTGEDFESIYLTPLAKTDLLHDHVLFNTKVTTVGRLSHRRDELDDMQQRCNDEFYLIVDSRHRGIYTARADVVIDCRGLTGKPQGLGPGGTIPIGQDSCQAEWLRYLPLDDRFEARHFEQKKTLVVGTQPHAVQFVQEFYQVAWNEAAKLFWLVRPNEVRRMEEWLQSFRGVTGHPLPQVSILNGYGVSEVSFSDNQFNVKVLLSDESTNEMSFDHLYVPDESVFDESIIRNTLYVELHSSHSNLPKPAAAGKNLEFTTTEPHYYVIRPTQTNQDSPYAASHIQIRDLFALLGGRNDLDLYSIVAQQQT